MTASTSPRYGLQAQHSNQEDFAVSVAALARELVMQSGSAGVTLEALHKRMPNENRRTIARVLQVYAAAGFIREEAGRHYPPKNWPTAYFIDRALVNIHDAGDCASIDSLAYRVPCAPPILLGALTALELMGVVEITDDRQRVRLLELGRERLRSGRQARTIIKMWKPPKSI